MDVLPYAPQGKEVVHDEQPFLFDVILYFCRDKKRIITALITQRLFMINWKEHITSDKNILLGKPTIKGTRISIEHLNGLFAQGWSEQQILENYPKLTDNDLVAVFAYVREGLQDGVSGGGNTN